MENEILSATLTVAAPADRVFAVLADPTIHAAIDGTGWIQECVDREPLTRVGQLFRMGMFHTGHPDGDYRVVNEVVVLDAPRAIGWMTGTETADGEPDLGGWVWRYDLVPAGPSQVEVTLTYDWSKVPDSRRGYIQFPPFGPDHLGNSLDHLAGLAGQASPRESRGAARFTGSSSSR